MSNINDIQIIEIIWAKQCIEKMMSSLNLEEYEKSWIDFLHYIDRAWNKTTGKYSSLGFNVKIIENVLILRNTDPLLQYLKQARNCDEHTVNSVVKKIPGHTTIKAGPQGLIINRGVFNGNGETENLKHEGYLDIYFQPDQLVICDVINRGILYKAPKNHLDEIIKTQVPHEIAQIGFDFYSGVFTKLQLK